MLEFKPFDKPILMGMLRDPRGVRNNPYLIFIAYFWDQLKDDLYQFLYDDEDPEMVTEYDEFTIDGKKIEKSIFETILGACMEDIVSAQQNRLTVRINDKPYRVNKFPEIDPAALPKFFNFEVHDDLVTISLDKVNTYIPTGDDYEMGIDQQTKNSRSYLHKIVYLVENDDDGWDKLTDIEAVAYTWAVKMAKCEGKEAVACMPEILKFVKYVDKELCDMDIENLQDCWIHDFNLAKVTIDAQFSSTLMEKWNKKHKQKSYIDEIDDEKAKEFWYDNCTRLFYGKNV